MGADPRGRCLIRVYASQAQFASIDFSCLEKVPLYGKRVQHTLPLSPFLSLCDNDDDHREKRPSWPRLTHLCARIFARCCSGLANHFSHFLRHDDGRRRPTEQQPWEAVQTKASRPRKTPFLKRGPRSRKRRLRDFIRIRLGKRH